jgi:hypothetical protein
VGRLLVTALVAAALCVPAASASTARSGTDAQKWATTVCGNISTWEKALERRSNSFTKSLNGKDLAGLKTAFVAFLDDSVDLTDTMIGRVDAAGAPDVPRGAQIEGALRSGLATLRRIFAKARADAASLPATSATKLGLGMQRIGQTIQKQASALGATFDRLDKRYPSKQLDAAWRKSPACRRI